MFSRRAFIKGLATGVGYSILPRSLRAGSLSAGPPVPPPTPTAPVVEPFYAFNLYHDVGRSLEYCSIARHCLMVDEVGMMIPIYDHAGKDIPAVVGHYRNGEWGTETIANEQIFVPIYERQDKIAQPMSAAEYDKQRGEMAQRFLRHESRGLTAILDKAVDAYGCQEVVATGIEAGLNAGFRQIEQHDLIVANVVCNASTYKKWIKPLGKNVFDPASQREMILSNRYGLLWTAVVGVVNNKHMDNDTFYIMATPDSLGAFVIRNTTACGNELWTETGMAIINSYAVSRVKMI